MGVVVAGRVLGPGVMTIAAVLLPPDPEPAEDWPALYALAAEAQAELLTAHMAVAAAGRVVQALQNRIREYEVAAE